MIRNKKRWMSVFLAMMLAMGLFLAAPAAVFGATEYNAGDNAEFAAALASMGDGDTINLTGTIGFQNEFPDPIIVDGFEVTINLNAFDLWMYVNGSPAILLKNGGTLIVEGSGDISIYSSGTAGIEADSGVLLKFDSVGIYTHGSMGGVYANNFSNVSITTAYSSFGATAVTALNSSQVWVDGNVEPDMGIGVYVENMSTVVVDGVIKADPYISLAGDVRTAAQYETDLSILKNHGIPGYRVYIETGAKSAVAVRNHDSFAAQTGSFTGSGDALFEIDKDFELFSTLMHVGVKELEPDVHYSATEGSTIITLFESYLSTLDDGTHTFHVHFIDGDFAVLTVEIAGSTIAAPTQPPVTNNPNNNNVPQTGESSGVWQIVLLLVAVAGVGTLAVLRRRLAKE